MLTFFVALWLLIFSLLKAGKLVNYISAPVMGGFITGICTTIILMQVPKLMGGTAGVGEFPELAEHSAVCVPTMMPYITAFFMPRTKGDRPDVIPDGCVNFAFLGQFAETPRDTVFTTEYSVRTAMEAVYGLLGVDRGVPEVWGSVYDVRELLDSSVKLMDGMSPLEIELPGPLNALKKPLLRVVKGTVVEKLLRDHNVIKDGMLD